jgi:putative flippase GtrA
VSEPSPQATPYWRRLAHIGGFLLAGSLAFVTDVAIFQAAYGLLLLPALLARPLSISVAMVVSWLINRRVTFPMPGRPNVSEFLHFAAFAWAAAAFNYMVFAAILWISPAIWPPLAIFFSSLAAMVLAYANMRFSVFRQR